MVELTGKAKTNFNSWFLIRYNCDVNEALSLKKGKRMVIDAMLDFFLDSFSDSATELGSIYIEVERTIKGVTTFKEINNKVIKRANELYNTL